MIIETHCIFSIQIYLFLEPGEERGGHRGQAGKGLAKLDGSVHQIAEEGHRDAVHVRHGGAFQLDAPGEKRHELLSFLRVLFGLCAMPLRQNRDTGPG